MTSQITVDAPEGMDLLDIAQAVVGPHILLKAEELRYSDRTFRRYKAMAELAQHFESAYRDMVRKLVREILTYASKNILLGTLGKADGKKPYKGVIDPKHLDEIRKLVADYHQAFVAAQIGPEAINPADVQRLIDSGILPQDLAYSYQPGPGERPSEAAEVIAEAYNYGVSMGREPALRAQAATLGLGAYRDRPPPRLSAQERSAREWAQTSAAQSVVGLGNRVADDFSTIAIEADAELRRQYQADIQGELDLNIERRDQWREMASKLGHKTQDWARDMKRISATEMQHAMQEGLVSGLIEREGDPDTTYVAKQPSPDACPDCVRLHLTAGPGSNPKIFKLSALMANGTNRGVKRNAWKATVGPVHPWCSCELIHVPTGWGFDEEGNLVPESLLRSDLLSADLQKAGHLTYGHIVPDKGVAILLSDPSKKLIAQKVVDASPKEIFDKRIGVTLICEDEPRVENALDEHDLAYWTGNEIRVSGRVPADKLEFVLQHELGHSLNVYLMYAWGGDEPVKRWHNKLFRVSREEGFVSPYAATAPIENAAELTRLYLYDRKLLIGQFPRAFAMLHKAYRRIWDDPSPDRSPRAGEAAKQQHDKEDVTARGGAKL